jgi:hypothetical protein
MASTNEDEFFAKQTAELVEQERQKQIAEDQQAERASHFMKCPKCGADLVEEDYRGVRIDRCPDCNGVWFDTGEIEKMGEADEDGFVGGVLKSVFRLGGTDS